MKEHCCDRMKQQVNHICEQHPDPFDCPDKCIFYDIQFDEYGIINHDGGHSYFTIFYCPWCGIKLPESKRDLWFDTLSEMGFDDPFTRDIPDKYKSDEWYMK